MKRLSTALVATALLALAGCGSRTVNNSAIIDTSNDVYNVSPDDLTVNDLGNGSSNTTTTTNTTSSSNTSSTSNASSGNSASSHAGNSH